MVENSSQDEPSEEQDESNLGEERLPVEGQSRFRSQDNLQDWLERKDKKQAKRACSVFPKRVGLNRISKKGKKKQQEYAKAKEEHYKDDANRRCMVCGSTRNLSVHHSKKRTEGNHSKQETFITLCLLGDYFNKLYPELNQSGSGCHGFVEANKSWAKLNGYLK